MTALNKGISGAKRATYSGASPRELLVRVMESCNANAHDDTIYSRFEDEVLGDQLRCARTIIRWWFDNNIRALRDAKKAAMPFRNPGSVKVSATLPREQAAQQMVEVMKTNIAKIKLREMLLPNDKKLKDCTFGEIRKLAPVVGDWLARVGAKGKKDEIVGRVLSEVDLHELYSA